MMLNIGTGKIVALAPPRYLYSGSLREFAAALATAIDTPKAAFAPILLKFSVPSRAINASSIAF